MFGRIMLGFVIMGVGGLMVYYSAKLVETFGRSRWADEHLGGTKDMRVLIGFGTAVVGGLIMLGIVSFVNPADVDTTGF